MKLIVLLALLTVSEGSTSVSGRTGQNITLSCKYDIKHGALSACWNRGEIPLSSCNNRLISTDGHRVIKETGASIRYQLVGRLDKGDVSLTILNVSERDSGRYGCRVEIPGWFNDEAHHFDVTVMRAAETTTTMTTTTKMSTLNREMTTEESTHTSTAGHATSTSLQTSSFNSVETKQRSSGAVVVVFIVLGLVFLVTAGGVVIIARRWRRLNKISQQQQHTSDQFIPTSSTLQLHARGSAVENIYQIDVGTDGGEYEYCP